MALKRSRFGTFLGCTGYPECKNIRKIGPKAEPPEAHRRRLPGVRPGRDAREEIPTRQDLLLLQPLSGLQVRALEQAGPESLPGLRRPLLVEKTTKKKGTRLLCQAEGCGFEEPVEEGATA